MREQGALQARRPSVRASRERVDGKQTTCGMRGAVRGRVAVLLRCTEASHAMSFIKSIGKCILWGVL